MDRRIDIARHDLLALAARQHRVVTRRQARSVGFSAKRVATARRSGWLSEPIPGVLNVTGAPVTWEQRLMSVILAAGGHAVASHRSAARLLGLDGFDTSRNAALEVSVSRSFRLAPGVAAVVHHVTPMEPCDITTVSGIPCGTVPRCLADLGSVVASMQVRRALTSARRDGLDLGLTRSVVERLHRPGQRGTGVLLRLLDAIPWEGQLPATWFEELLALCLEDPSLPPMELQYEIRDGRGGFVARPDIAFPSVQLGLEAHSRRFHFGPDNECRDEDRDLRAAAVGWELIYLGWYATRRPAEVLALVKQAIGARRRLMKSGLTDEL